VQLESKRGFYVILRLQMGLITAISLSRNKKESRASAYVDELVHVFNVHFFSADLSNEVHQPQLSKMSLDVDEYSVMGGLP
jgi:hypothetical protein